jgi:hypothetical protein
MAVIQTEVVPMLISDDDSGKNFAEAYSLLPACLLKHTVVGSLTAPQREAELLR